MNQPQAYTCLLPIEPLSYLLPHSTPLGCHRAPDLRSLCRTANFHWLSNLHMMMYVFQCYTLHSSHPLLPLGPQVSSLCLHLHCCLANRFISTLFLDSTCCAVLCCSTSYVQLFVTPWTIACQTSLSMEFSREYWSGWPFPPPGDLPNPGMEPGFPTSQAGFLLSEPPEKPVLFSPH